MTSDNSILVRSSTSPARAGAQRFARGAGRVRPAFTLIEVLVAMVMMALIVPAVMRGVSVAAKSAAHAQHMSEAAALAEMVLSQVLSQSVVEGYSQVNQPIDRWPGYSSSVYAYAATDTQVDYLLEVDVTISWTEDTYIGRSYSISTYVFNDPAIDQIRQQNLQLGGVQQ